MYRKSQGMEILEAPLRLLRLHQLWPPLGKKLTDFWPLIRFTSVICFCAITYCFSSMHLWFLYEHPHTIVLVDLIEDIILNFLYITVYYTIYVLIIHIRELDEFMYDLSDYTRFGKPPGIDEANKTANYFTYFFYVYGISGTALYSLSGLVDKADCHQRDVHNTRACGFLLPMRFPFNVDTMEKFIITWIMQACSLNMFLTSGIIIMSYLYSSVEIFNAKIAHLKEEIMKLGEKPENAHERVRYCVEYHVKIISMCKNLNTCWGSLMLYHQILVTIIESLIGIQFLLKFDPKYVVHGSAWLISLAIPCYAGQRLLDEASGISLAIYTSKWYNLDKQSMKDLVYMMMCANKYLDLNRDGYGPVNLSIVGKVINNIYSVLMLLYTSMAEL